MRRALLTGLLLTLTVGVGAVVAVPTAFGATTCTSTLSGGTINGPVVVPSGASCEIDNAKVNGNISVRSGAELGTNNTVVNGSISADGAHLKLFTTTITGEILDNHPTDLQGTVTPSVQPADQQEGFSDSGIFCQDKVIGSLAVVNGPRPTNPVVIGGGGPFGEGACFGMELNGNTVGALNVQNNAVDVFVQDNTIQNNAQVTGNTGVTHFDHNTVGGSFSFKNNPGGGSVTFNSIGANLSVTGNGPTCVQGNTVKGSSSVTASCG